MYIAKTLEAGFQLRFESEDIDACERVLQVMSRAPTPVDVVQLQTLIDAVNAAARPPLSAAS
ncbi:MAG TPA: hypothetical protein VGU65_12580 [Frateuria sp.]|uniref:hypothetical protein n=1 Tax=Frateuria sp. TaxID=2211372 RepID=UPI002DEC20A4|nr:hypothetical protein [Frateuria sp.]